MNRTASVSAYDKDLIRAIFSRFEDTLSSVMSVRGYSVESDGVNVDGESGSYCYHVDYKVSSDDNEPIVVTVSNCDGLMEDMKVVHAGDDVPFTLVDRLDYQGAESLADKTVDNIEEIL